MTHRFARLRRFRFNLPQRIAAGLLFAFLIQGLWLTSHQALTDRDYQYARCGREMWEQPSQLAGYFTSCGNIRDGILAYRLAGLPLTLNLLAERGLDHFRKPEDRVVLVDGDLSASNLSPWELRHQLRYTLLLLRLPFLAAGLLLGGGLWWRTAGDRPGKNTTTNAPAVIAAVELFKATGESRYRAAAEAIDGPVLIIAGPGTGKTRTLTHRLAHLIADCGAAPEACLTLTFSRRAAGEMVERLVVALVLLRHQVGVAWARAVPQLAVGRGVGVFVGERHQQRRPGIRTRSVRQRQPFAGRLLRRVQHSTQPLFVELLFHGAT